MYMYIELDTGIYTVHVPGIRAVCLQSNLQALTQYIPTNTNTYLSQLHTKQCSPL